MNRTFFRATLAVAVLSLAACGRGDADDRGGDEPPATRPAGQQPASTAQNQAAPQTGPNTPQGNNADFTDPPVENRDTVHRAGAGQTYASCMARANGATEGEKQILQRTCRNLPDAPKQ